MGQSELIETDILCVFLSLALALPFIKSLGVKIDDGNSTEKQYGIMGSGQHLTLHQKLLILIILSSLGWEEWDVGLECFFLHDWKLLWFVSIAWQAQFINLIFFDM